FLDGDVTALRFKRERNVAFAVRRVAVSTGEKLDSEPGDDYKSLCGNHAAKPDICAPLLSEGGFQSFVILLGVRDDFNDGLLAESRKRGVGRIHDALSKCAY